MYLIIKERENKEREVNKMRTNENKGLTTEELKKVVELLKKEENVEILEGLESLIRWMVVEKKLNIK